ncbi:MAG TPA: hypothetical protein VH988_20445 [Thermoanaerobaculia bacterium]|nr:hypothetical protein [Thermoanaerobaculia bacterium]
MSFRIMDLMVDVTPLPLAACPNSGPGGDDCPNSDSPDDCPNSGTTGFTRSWSEAALPELRRQLRATLEARV